mmetsp:Transcript_43282/g.101826  ORF Transcript_43282/g.101826 Transcript_43282/m.101826 type:complete len:622 (-) Transcript_43282:112-1977(-)
MKSIPPYHSVYNARQSAYGTSNPNQRARQKQRLKGLSKTSLENSTYSLVTGNEVGPTYPRSYGSGWVADPVVDPEATRDGAGEASFFAEVPAHLEDCRVHLAEADKELEKYFTMVKDELTLAALRAIPAGAAAPKKPTLPPLQGPLPSPGSSDFNMETCAAIVQSLEQKLQDQTRDSEQQIDEAQGKVTMLEERLLATDAEASRLRSELEEAQMQVTMLTSQVNNLHARLYVSETALAETKEKLEVLEQGHEVDAQAVEMQRQASKSLQQSLCSNEEEVQTLRDENETLRMQHTSRLIAKDVLFEAVEDSLSSQVFALQEAVDERDVDIADLKLHRERLIADMDKLHKDHEGTLRALHDEKNELAKEMSEKDCDMEDLKADRQKLVDVMERLQADYQALAEAGDAVGKERDALLQRVQDLEQSLADQAAGRQGSKGSVVGTSSFAEVPLAEARGMPLVPQEEHPFRTRPQKQQQQQQLSEASLDDLESFNQALTDCQLPQLLHAAEIVVEAANDEVELGSSLPSPCVPNALRPALCHLDRSRGELCLKPLSVAGPSRVIPLQGITKLQRSSEFPAVVDIEFDNLHMRLATSDEESCEYLEALLGVNDRLLPGACLPVPVLA